MLALLLASTLALAADSACTAPATAPRLDHVVIAVRDLAAAAARFAALGYRLKPGRLHPDNLLSEHIKFVDGSELELMTLAGPPGDRMAEEYAALIAAGDGGAYVALRTSDLEAVDAAARRLDLTPRRSTAGSWEFLSFPARSDAGAVFFVSGGERLHDPDSLVQQADGASGVREAWLEAGPGLARLLAMVGARDCGPASGPGGRRGDRHALNSSYLTLVPRSDSSALPRVLGVRLETVDTGGPRGQVRFALPTFWIETW